MPSSNSPFWSFRNGRPVADNASPTAWPNGGIASRAMRRIGIGPRLPCSGPSKSRSVSSLRKVWQHIRPAPAARAEVAPFVVVARQATIGRLHVNAGAATHHPPLLVGADNRLAASVAAGRSGKARPDIFVAEEQRHRIAVEDFVRRCLGGGVHPGFRSEARDGARGGQAVGKHAARRPAADDHIVEMKIIHSRLVKCGELARPLMQLRRLKSTEIALGLGDYHRPNQIDHEDAAPK